MTYSGVTNDIGLEAARARRGKIPEAVDGPCRSVHVDRQSIRERTEQKMARTTSPVADWATDFDVLDPSYIEDPFSIWRELRDIVPDRPHRQARQQLAADPLRRRHRDRARHRALQLSQGGRDPVPGRGAAAGRPHPRARPATDLGRPAASHLDTQAAASLVLAQPGRHLRALHPRAVRAARRPVSYLPGTPTPPSTTRSRSPSG